MTIDAQTLSELHEMTLETYRLRVQMTADTQGFNLPPTAVDSLARMIDMCAAERVLDEADYEQVPGWEHPVNRATRERLAHAESVILTLASIPATLRADLDPTAPAADAQETVLSAAEAATGAALSGIAATAVSPVIGQAVRSVIDYMREALAQRAMAAMLDENEPNAMHTSKVLLQLADSLCPVRAAVFRPVDAYVPA